MPRKCFQLALLKELIKELCCIYQRFKKVLTDMLLALSPAKKKKKKALKAINRAFESCFVIGMEASSGPAAAGSTDESPILSNLFLLTLMLINYQFL